MSKILYFELMLIEFSLPTLNLRRHGGVVVSALDFCSGGWWFEPGLCRHDVSIDKKIYSTLPLFTQVCKWVPAIIMVGVTLQWTSIPSRGEQQYSQSLYAGFVWVLEILESPGILLLAFSRTGKSCKMTTSLGKSWRSVFSQGSLL